MATMKAVRIHQYGSNAQVVYEDAPRPTPAADELLLRVLAAAVSPMDWKMREGYIRQWVDPPLPLILGRDLAGDIETMGPQVSGFQVGEAVFGMVPLTLGTHAEYVAVPARLMAPKPPALDYVLAAAVPLSALAAWQALVETAGLTAGQTVLIHAAAGGVGHFAIQLARARGARVIGTASAANATFVRDLGADTVIDYQATPFEEAVHDVDVVLDTIGGDTQARSWQVLKPGGMLVSLIGLDPRTVEQARAQGQHAAMVGTRPEAGQLQQIAELIVAGQVRPVVSTILPLAEARQAYELSQSGHTRGKIVLQIESA